MGYKVWEFKICSLTMHLWMHATSKEEIFYIPTFPISFFPIIFVLTKWVVKTESRIRSLSTWLLWLSMEMYIDHLGAKLLLMYWATHLIQSKKGCNKSAPQPVHRGCSYFLGAKWGWHKHLIQVLVKNHTSAPYLYDYSCFYVDLIKTGPFTKDWGFYIVVKHDGDKPVRCLVCKVSLQQSRKDQPESPWSCLKATGRAAARDPVKDSVMRLPRWACIRAVCHAPFCT